MLTTGSVTFGLDTTIAGLWFMHEKLIEWQHLVIMIKSKQLILAASTTAAAVTVSDYLTYVQLGLIQYPSLHFSNTVYRLQEMIVARISQMHNTNHVNNTAEVDRSNGIFTQVCALLQKLSNKFGFTIPGGFIRQVRIACQMRRMSMPSSAFIVSMAITCAMVITGSFVGYTPCTNFRMLIPHFDEMLSVCGVHSPHNSTEFRQTVVRIHKLVAFMVGIGSKSSANAPLSMYLNATPESKAATFLANVKASNQ
jgi:hypothetical protein